MCYSIFQNHGLDLLAVFKSNFIKTFVFHPIRGSGCMALILKYNYPLEAVFPAQLLLWDS